MARSSVHRTAIIDLHKKNFTAKEIIKRLGVPKQTVYDAIKRYEELGTLCDRVGRGRRVSVTTPERVKAVRMRIRRNAHRSIRRMSRDMKISNTSMRRIVKLKLRMTPYRVRKAAILSEANKKKRLEKAKRLLAGTRRKEHLVTVFSDEKLFTVEAEFNAQNHRVIAQTSQQAVENGRTIHRSPHPASVMVFGAICSTGKCPLIFVEKGVKIDKEVYINDILEKNLVPWASKHFAGKSWIFQQDGAPAHTAKKTQQWCETHMPRFIKASDWPASSPDLNPLDYSVWGVLQERVNAKPHSSLDALKKTLEKEWDNLSTDYLRATVEAYPRRLRAVISAKGGRVEQK